MAAKLSKNSLLLILPIALLVGCGQLLFSYKGARVRQESQIPLLEGAKQSGTYQTRDLTVDYRYLRNTGGLELAGAIRFDDSVRNNFTSLRNFSLGVLFLDAQGRVLGSRGLRSSRFGDPDYQPTFAERVEPPEGTASMAFIYSGEAREHGGNGATQAIFQHHPVLR